MTSTGHPVAAAPVTAAAPAPLTALEIVGGYPTGPDPTARALPPPIHRDPLDALHDAVLPALLRPPCVVSFSGGRDSSAVLAVATDVALRHGLDPPVPVTLVFPDAPASDESGWQHRVVGHLGLREWTRVQLTDELDLVGPVATRMLRTHGISWPPNAHFHEPVLALAGGGSMLTGIDGDGLFANWQWARAVRVLTAAARPERRDLLRIAKAASPAILRTLADNARAGPIAPWIRPAAARSLTRTWNSDAAGEPLHWRRRVAWFAGRRDHSLTIHSMCAMAREHDVAAIHPLADPGFLAALADRRPWRGFPDRTETMSSLFGSLLPVEVLGRATKAHFTESFATERTRAFASSWTGGGVDHELVDADRLREAWTAPMLPPSSALLLHAALRAGPG